MKMKSTAAEMNSTIHSVAGITPSAPCVRSLRATSRSARRSSHFEKAACSLALFGSTACTVRNILRPHGLKLSRRVPDSIRAHSSCTTVRA